MLLSRSAAMPARGSRPAAVGVHAGRAADRSRGCARRWRSSATSTRCPTTPSRRPGARRCAASAASSDTARAHCLEAALSAAVILEQHGYPPLVLSFESIDELDHVIFVYRQRGRWGSVARSRDPGLHGRKPVFAHAARAGAQLLRSVRRLHRPRHRLRGRRSARDGRLRLAAVGRNVWKVERMLLDAPHRPIRSSDARIDRLRRRYRAFCAAARPQAAVLPRTRPMDGDSQQGIGEWRW